MQDVMEKLGYLKFQMREWGSIYRFILLCCFAMAFSCFWPDVFDLPFVLLFGAFFELIQYIGKRAGRDALFTGVIAPTAVILVLILRHSDIGRDVLCAVLFWYAAYTVMLGRYLLKAVLAVLVFLSLYYLKAADVTKPMAAVFIIAILTELSNIFAREGPENTGAGRTSGCANTYERPKKGGIIRIWLPFFTIYVFLVALLPVSAKPFDWSFVYQLTRDIREQASNAAADLEYFFQRLGFRGGYVSGYNGLGNRSASLAASDRKELYISERIPYVLYLDGVSYVTFGEDGRWTGRSAVSEYDSGWLALYLNALRREGITREEAQCFSEIYERTIIYGQMRTRDLMHPLNTMILGDSAQKELEPGGGFLLRKSRKRGFAYDVTLMELDTVSPYLLRVFRNRSGTDPDEYATYSEISAYMTEVYKKPFNRYFSLTEYMNCVDRFSNMDLAPYLDTSGTTERMRELALSLTEGRDSDFDKCMAIEAYLRQYRYSTQPPEVPEGENWLDYFLFEAGEGYCVHYASAMVELCRLAGIPARYTEGYVCRFKEKPEEGDAKGYPVRGSEAHAWPEVWINGFGFVKFEPTAGMPNAAERAWGKLTRADQGIAEGGAAVAALEPYAMPEPDIEFAGYEEPEQEEEEDRAAAILEAVRRWVLILFLLILVIIVYLLLMLVFRRIWLNLKYRRAGLKDRMMMEQKDIRWIILELTGRKAAEKDRGDNETMLETAARLAKAADNIDARNLYERAVKSVYVWYAYSYGDHEPGTEDLRDSADFRKALYTVYLEKAGSSLIRGLLLRLRAMWQLSCVYMRDGAGVKNRA